MWPQEYVSMYVANLLRASEGRQEAALAVGPLSPAPPPHSTHLLSCFLLQPLQSVLTFLSLLNSINNSKKICPPSEFYSKIGAPSPPLPPLSPSLVLLSPVTRPRARQCTTLASFPTGC